MESGSLSFNPRAAIPFLGLPPIYTAPCVATLCTILGTWAGEANSQAEDPSFAKQPRYWDD